MGTSRLKANQESKCPNEMPPGSFLRQRPANPMPKEALPSICGAHDSLQIAFHTCLTQGHKQGSEVGLQVKLPLITATHQHLLTLKPLSQALSREYTEHSKKEVPSGFSHPERAKNSPVYETGLYSQHSTLYSCCFH